MGINRITGLISALVAITLIAGVFSSVALSANAPPAIPTKTPTNPGGSGGSGVSSGGGYSQPRFEPYVIPLLSSNGDVIGNVTGRNFFSNMIWAGVNTTMDNESYGVAYEAEIKFKPGDFRMDVNLSGPGCERLPQGMCSTCVMSVVNISRNGGYGWWDVNPGTMKLSFKVPSDAIAENCDTGTYYIVRYDGDSYHIQKPEPAIVTDNGTAVIFEVRPATGDTGVFSLVSAMMATPTPSPTPAPCPTPSETADPVAEDNGNDVRKGLLSPVLLSISFIMGLVSGSAGVYFIVRQRK